MVSSGVSDTAGRRPGSGVRSAASSPCSGAVGLPRPVLGVRSTSLCPIAWAGVGPWLPSLGEATGVPGASIL
eukprot:2278942-Amphidinium_carterae.1